MLANIKTAIFDMDGTLLDTMPYWRFTTLEYLLARGWPVTQELLSVMPVTSSRRLIRTYAVEQGLPMDEPGLIPELEAYMNRHYLYDARPKDRVREWLAALAERGVRMCVATGSPREYARNGLARAGILDRFEFVTDNYEGPWRKDQPAYFHWVLDRLGATAEGAWVFEDALYAAKSAKAAGLHVCAIHDATELQQEALKEIADVYVKDWGDMLERWHCQPGQVDNEA